MAKKKQKTDLETIASQRDLHEQLKPIVPKALAILERILDCEDALIRDRFAAAKLIVEKAIPNAPTYKDKSVQVQPEKSEEINPLTALADAMRGVTDDE